MHHFLATLLIVWHSRTSASEQLAVAAAQSAQKTLEELECEKQIQVLCLPVQQVHSTHLLKADAYLFCAPENLGALSGEMKAFFDQNYYTALNQINGKPYGLIISAGSAGQGAVRQAESICTGGWRLHAVAPSIIVNTAAQTTEEILATKIISPAQAAPAIELGGILAAQLALGLG